MSTDVPHDLVCSDKMMFHCCQNLEIASMFKSDFKTAVHDVVGVIIRAGQCNIMLSSDR